MKVSFSRLDRLYSKYKEKYDEAMVEVGESGWYILGENLKRFECEFANFTESKHCIGLNSGLDALILAFRALGIGKGDEVIVPANTYIASVIGITENGATPIFVEPDEFYNIDSKKIEERITKRTKAILVVHLYGQSADMINIKKITDKHDLYLVEDCAQSHGAKFAGQVTGSWGDIGCFSFYPTKNIGAFGDSGAVVTGSDELYEKIKMLRNYGSKIKYQNEIIGVNSRMDEIQAKILSIKLGHYGESLNERNYIAERYLNEIKNENIELPKVRNKADHVWHLFVIRVKNRNDFIEYMENNGIGVQIHYPIPPHLSQAYKYLAYKKGDLKITERLSKEIVSLPLFEGMTDEEISYIVKKANNYESR